MRTFPTATTASLKTAISNTTDNWKQQYGHPNRSTDSMIDIIEIPTANIGFSTKASSKLCESNIWLTTGNGPPETGNTYISETMTDEVEIPTASVGTFMTM